MDKSKVSLSTDIQTVKVEVPVEDVRLLEYAKKKGQENSLSFVTNKAGELFATQNFTDLGMGFWLAKKDFIVLPLHGTNAITILVPHGIYCLGGKVGHNALFFEDDNKRLFELTISVLKSGKLLTYQAYEIKEKIAPKGYKLVPFVSKEKQNKQRNTKEYFSDSARSERRAEFEASLSLELKAEFEAEDKAIVEAQDKPHYIFVDRNGYAKVVPWNENRHEFACRQEGMDDRDGGANYQYAVGYLDGPFASLREAEEKADAISEATRNSYR